MFRQHEIALIRKLLTPQQQSLVLITMLTTTKRQHP